MSELRRLQGSSTETSESRVSRSDASSPMVSETTSGLRFDSGKVKLHLIPPEWVMGLGDVLTFGATKYDERNWELGMPFSKVYSPMQRHSWKWWDGEKEDEESGLHHMLHTAWNALALYSYDLRGIGEDDRP
jgi:hypothetical protein